MGVSVSSAVFVAGTYASRGLSTWLFQQLQQLTRGAAMKNSTDWSRASYTDGFGQGCPKNACARNAGGRQIPTSPLQSIWSAQGYRSSVMQTEFSSGHITQATPDLFSTLTLSWVEPS